MEVYPAVLACDRADLLYWLDDAGLVIHRHHRNERSVWADRGFEFLEVKNTIFFDSEVGNVETFLLQLSARIKNTLVFLFWKTINQIEPRGHVALTHSLGGNYMTLFLLVEPGNAFDRHVVGFGCARSENNIFGVGTNEIGNILFNKNRCAEYFTPQAG